MSAMKSLRISFNISPAVTAFYLIIICLFTNLNAQQLGQLINGSLRTPGSLDNNFLNFKNYPIGLDSSGLPLSAQFIGPSPDIRAAAVQADGKILIGGTFQIQQRNVRYRDSLGITVIWRNLARLNADGTLDLTFMSESVVPLIEAGNFGDLNATTPLIWGPDGAVYSISTELNEDSYQYIISGDFLNFSHNSLGFSAPRLRYLVLDALTTDPAGRFAEPRIQLATERAEGNGFDSPVRKLTRISGGGVVPQTEVVNQEARLALTLVQAPVGSIVLQLNTATLFRRIGEGNELEDWFVLAGEFDPPSYYVLGDFIKVFDNETQPYVVRVSRDGTALTTHEDWILTPGPNARVNDIAVDSGDAVIVGEFTDLGGRIAKIDDTGLVDVAFNSGETGFNNHAYACVLDPVLLAVTVVGDFTNYNGATVGRIARLDSLTGTHDATFPAANNGNSTGANGTIRAMTRQPDGRMLIAGSFTTYNGIPRSGIARLEPDGSLDTSFTPKGDASGVLAFASDFNGGPGSANLFARPIVVGNFNNLYGNSGFKGVARLLGGSFPGVWYQPAEIEVSASPSPFVAVAGSDKSLHVVASDNRIGYDGIPPAVMPFVPALSVQAPSEPLLYQWQFNQKDIPGANQSSLDLNDVKYAQAGSYRVKIYNSQYFIESQTVQLTVLNPFIGVIPASGIKVNGRIDANAGLNSNLGGVISMTISRLGTVTGTITMAGSGSKPLVYKFAGQFNETGNLVFNIPRQNLSPLTLTLDMDLTGAPTNDFEFDSLVNSISDGVNTAQISAWSNRWSLTNQASAYAGQYNVSLVTNAVDLALNIPVGPVTPNTRAKVSQGYGYFSMNVVASTGEARIAGTLSDGSKFTTVSSLWGDTPATLPIWIPLYKGAGALQGGLSINGIDPEKPVTADLDWTKRAGLAKTTDTYGFTNVNLTASAESGLYIASDFTATLPNFDLTFNDGIWTATNGGLSAPPFSQSFNVAGTTVTPVLPNLKSVKIAINQKTGLVTGSFMDPDAYGANRTVKFQSIILTRGAPVLRGNYVMPNTAKYPGFYVGGSVEGY